MIRAVSHDFTGAFKNRSGTVEWYKNGKYHREDGPAIEFSDGTKKWYLNDIRYYSQLDWFQALTPEQKLNAIWSLQ